MPLVIVIPVQTGIQSLMHRHCERVLERGNPGPSLVFELSYRRRPVSRSKNLI